MRLKFRSDPDFTKHGWRSFDTQAWSNPFELPAGIDKNEI